VVAPRSVAGSAVPGNEPPRGSRPRPRGPHDLLDHRSELAIQRAGVVWNAVALADLAHLDGDLSGAVGRDVREQMMLDLAAQVAAEDVEQTAAGEVGGAERLAQVPAAAGLVLGLFLGELIGEEVADRTRGLAAGARVADASRQPKSGESPAASACSSSVPWPIAAWRSVRRKRRVPAAEEPIVARGGGVNDSARTRSSPPIPAKIWRTASSSAGGPQTAA
jgi:hypothetical protein